MFWTPTVYVPHSLDWAPVSEQPLILVATPATFSVHFPLPTTSCCPFALSKEKKTVDTCAKRKNMKRVFWSLDVYLNRPSYQLAEGYSYTRVSHIHIIHHTHWMECLVLCSLTYLINTLRTIHQRSHIHNSHLPSIYLHTYLMWWLILGWDEMRCAENEI